MWLPTIANNTRSERIVYPFPFLIPPFFSLCWDLLIPSSYWWPLSAVIVGALCSCRNFNGNGSLTTYNIIFHGWYYILYSLLNSKKVVYGTVDHFITILWLEFVIFWRDDLSRPLIELSLMKYWSWLNIFTFNHLSLTSVLWLRLCVGLYKLKCVFDFSYLSCVFNLVHYSV